MQKCRSTLTITFSPGTCTLAMASKTASRLESGTTVTMGDFLIINSKKNYWTFDNSDLKEFFNNIGVIMMVAKITNTKVV